jgi:hypothetical protein
MNVKLLTILACIAMMIAACGQSTTATPTMDVGAIFTAAAETVVAEYTQIALSFAPTAEPTETPIPEPTATLAPTIDPAATQPLCDDSTFDPFTVDVSVPDGTQMQPGQDFVKTWKIKNSGTCIWRAGYSLVFAYGEKMGGVAQPLTADVFPGEEVEVSVQFKAPVKAGEYRSYWRMANTNGSAFGKNIYVFIIVR